LASLCDQQPAGDDGTGVRWGEQPQTPDRGILTGEQLIGLDLSRLELAVLSEYETGHGDVPGG